MRALTTLLLVTIVSGMHIGIFDSGIGGEAIAASLRKNFPQATITTVNDREHMPYGEKSSTEIIQLTDNALQPLLHAACDVIVIACNTATALAIESLRKRYPAQKFVGIEPMIRTASQLTKTKVIAVCATPSTLSSKRYGHLVEKYAKDIKIIEPDCREWAYLIENNALNREHIQLMVDRAIAENADVIVLGCTHYHWIKERIIDQIEGRALVIEPSEATIRQVKRLLKRF